MSRQLTPKDFNNLFRFFEHEAFRLETRPVYLVEVEQEPFAAFLRGELRPATDLPYYVAWLDQIRQATRSGRRVARVRVMEEPPTDYQRWEAWIGSFNVDAGEDIRYLTRGAIRALDIPDHYDWWLFDSTDLALMRFDPDGHPLGGEIVSDPDLIAQHCAWRDLAVAHSTPVAECPTAQENHA